MKPDNALLLLEDGTAFEGRRFGAEGEAAGVAVFYTGVVGYQEVVTDPSYRGTIAVLTYPIIGSYGVNGDDDESPVAQASGVVIKEYSRRFSNFRATGAFEDFLAARGVVGIQGVDTRAVAVHLRERGEMKALIASGDLDREALLARLRAAPSPFERDLVGELPLPEPLAGTRHRLAALNLGIKRSLLGQLAALGCAVDVLPPTATAADVLAREPEGLILAGGPGDPRVPAYAAETARALLGRLPLLGIGLGHQIVALALGCRIGRLRAGHHGVNHAIKDVVHGTAAITVQHHSFVVDREALPEAVEVTHVNVNDGSIEGIRGRAVAAFGVQFHPSPDEMGRPSRVLESFVEGEG